MNSKLQPIFIHSLFRSGSTYLFNCFRREHSQFTCYQEPDHEIISKLDDDPDYILSMTTSTLEELRHPDIGQPYFQETYDIRNALKGLFSEAYSFNEFFPEHPAHLPAGQQAYFNALIQFADKRPVLQLCRSFGRIHQLKHAFSGLHIHLWREPRTQWWSYLIDTYFENTINWIANAEHTPHILKSILHPALPPNECSFEQRYTRFFAVWLYSFIENLKYSDLEVSIDLLDSDAQYQRNITTILAEHNIVNIHFDDCKSPYTQLSESEISKYKAIEDSILVAFAQHTNIELLNMIKQKLNDIHRLKNVQAYQADKYRDIAVKQMNTYSNALLEYHSKLNHAESMYHDELTKAQQIVARLHQTELTLQQIEGSLQEAENKIALKTNDLEKLKLQLHQTEEDLAHHKVTLLQSETTLAQSQARLRLFETMLEQSQSRLQQIEGSLQEAENKITLKTNDLEKLKLQLHQTESMLLDAHAHIQHMLASHSWKITAPLRWLKQKLTYRRGAR